jgi:tRNA pseudouridine38-40 synthase
MYLRRMRYFMELAYNGAGYHGWQRQPGRRTIQQTLEEAMSLIARRPLEITGCGRTDAGVHARQYFAHVDHDGDWPANFMHRLNRLLPPHIAMYRIFAVDAQAHARYSAELRAYKYHLHYEKDPFQTDTAYWYRLGRRPQLAAMRAAAQLLLNYEDFFPYCRGDNELPHTRCRLFRAEWEVIDAQKLVFHIAANRFLRGMVRLIVGMCINVGLENISVEEVRAAMERKTLLRKALSAPPQGLTLSEVLYPFVEARP